MADRFADVLLLVASRHDGLWLPPGALRTASGFVPSVLEPCRSCGGVLLLDDFGKVVRRRKGRGWVRDRFGRKTPCSACGEAGWIARDPMDSVGARVGSSETAATARPRRTVRCDACDGEGVRLGERCPYCDGAGRRDLHAFELAFVPPDAVVDADPVDVAIDRRNDSGSYAELDRALAALRARSLPQLRALLALAETGERSDAAGAGLAFVAARMPAAVRVPAAVRANAAERRRHLERLKGRRLNGDAGRAVEARDREIRKLIGSGRPTQWVAFEFGLSVRRVNQIVAGERERAS